MKSERRIENPLLAKAPAAVQQSLAEIAAWRALYSGRGTIKADSRPSDETWSAYAQVKTQQPSVAVAVTRVLRSPLAAHPIVLGGNAGPAMIHLSSQLLSTDSMLPSPNSEAIISAEVQQNSRHGPRGTGLVIFIDNFSILTARRPARSRSDAGLRRNGHARHGIPARST
jgi:hypothetical protein